MPRESGALILRNGRPRSSLSASQQILEGARNLRLRYVTPLPISSCDRSRNLTTSVPLCASARRAMIVETTCHPTKLVLRVLRRSSSISGAEYSWTLASLRRHRPALTA